MQNNPNWYLILLDTDSEYHYPYLHNDISTWTRANEPFRISIRNSSEFPRPRWDTDQDLFENLHRRVYFSTDIAIRRLCPAESRFVVATNADNWYHPEFFQKVQEYADNDTTGADIVGVDFFSRHSAWIWDIPLREQNCNLWLHYTSAVCNGFSMGRSDLGSLAFNLQRWRADKISFSKTLCPVPSESDGCLVNNLRRKNRWITLRIPEPLFSHAPNPWLCFLYGGQLLHFPSEADYYQFQCVPSRDNAELLSQERLTTVRLPHGNCYHGARYGHARDILPIKNHSSIIEPPPASNSTTEPEVEPPVFDDLDAIHFWDDDDVLDDLDTSPDADNSTSTTLISFGDSSDQGKTEADET
jgi:hypothetical protein